MSELYKLTVRITPRALVRLKAECARRYALEARPTPMGALLTELIHTHLPDVEPAAARKGLAAESRRAKRKAEAA